MTSSYSPNSPNRASGASTTLYRRTQTEPVSLVEENLDVFGRLKMTSHQNIYDADFEYGPQPLRWENFTLFGGTITHLPSEGGVQMRLPPVAGAITIRQSRPYYRYQPGKSIFMATAVLFESAQVNQVNRVGFFDDSNGVFFEQTGTVSTANPFGMNVVVRSDAGGVINEIRVPLNQWNGDTRVASSINWNNIQMLWIEYAWDGAGTVRWGVTIGGRQITLHQIGFGNRPGQTRAWARTGNLPVRYEQRNSADSKASDMVHYGVSVMCEGGQDDQRGFTYAYGLPFNAPRKSIPATTNRVPLLAVRNRPMGTQEFTQAGAAITAGTTTTLTVSGNPWTANQWRGRFVNYINAGVSYTARILSNTTNVLTFGDVVTGNSMAAAPVAGQNYTIGMINRGQVLPRRLQLSSDQPVLVELFVSTPTSPINLTGANFVANAATVNSFALVDTSATAFTVSGECQYSIFVPADSSVDQEIDQLFPLGNNIQGSNTDVLAVVVSNPGATAANVSCQIIGQEAMT